MPRKSQKRTLHWGRPTTEKEATRTLESQADDDVETRTGVGSFSNLSKVAGSQGTPADARGGGWSRARGQNRSPGLHPVSAENLVGRREAGLTLEKSWLPQRA